MQGTSAKNINREALKDWVRNAKKINPYIEADLVKAVKISLTTLKKLMYLSGYKTSDRTVELLIHFTGLKASELASCPEDEAA